jgi:type IV secretory pathway component VirB8
MENYDSDKNNIKSKWKHPESLDEDIIEYQKIFKGEWNIQRSKMLAKLRWAFFILLLVILIALLCLR